MNLKETTFSRTKIYNGRSLNFYVDTIVLPNKKLATREYTEHPGAVTVLPFIDKKNIVLVKQYRYPVRKITYELPAGKLSYNESLKKCVQRELIEETGFKASKIKKLISFWPTPAFSTEVLHIFSATGLKPVKSNPDEDEFLEKIIIPFETALKWVKNGKIKDSKSIIGILFWKMFNKNI